MSNSKLFEKFSKKVLSNKSLVQKALKEITEYFDSEELKKGFSEYFYKTQELVYKKYLNSERKIGNSILVEFYGKQKKDIFFELDKFFLSLSQSRRQRAGKAFEDIIKNLFRRCNYPFDEQIVINGKPDFLMPSVDHYQENPMDCIVFTAKRTLRERWRQIVTEGTRAYGFFLATIDEQISIPQLTEMKNNKIFLVLPKKLKTSNSKYSEASNVISFEDFFEDYLDPAVIRWTRAGILN